MATASACVTSTVSQRTVSSACGVLSYCGLFSVMRPSLVGVPLSMFSAMRLVSGWPASKPPPRGSFSSVPASKASSSHSSSTGSPRSLKRCSLAMPTKESLESISLLMVERKAPSGSFSNSKLTLRPGGMAGMATAR